MTGTGQPTRKRQSYYVERSRAYPAAYGWTGPIRSHRQALREQAAWNDSGWAAIVFESTPGVRAAVREWQRQADKRHGRRQ
jgi:hypothetical protein